MRVASSRMSNVTKPLRGWGTSICGLAVLLALAGASADVGGAATASSQSPRQLGRLDFDGWFLRAPAGRRFEHMGPAGPFERTDLPDGGTAEIRSSRPLSPRTRYLRLHLPSDSTRAELAEDRSMAFDLDHGVPRGKTTYLAFAFRFPVAPRYGDWGYLILQAKSLVSNTRPLVPSLSLINTGRGPIYLRIGGGDAASGRIRWAKSKVLSRPVPGRWYRGILGVRFSPYSSGWAKVWLAPQGRALPPRARPTAKTRGPNVYIDTDERGRYVDPPSFFRIGPYHASGHGAITFDTIGFRRVSTFARARAELRRFERS